MPLLFANPWGLLALLGLPIVLAIHFLHRHRKAIPVSTLFLIDIAREPARSGRRWHRLLPSVPMWLQLLIVLLITALLSQPYQPKGVLHVALVIDHSASMRAFRKELSDHLAELYRTTSSGGRHTQWLVLPSNPTRPRFYAGENPQEWLATLETWSPADSWYDPTNALRIARDRVGPNGLVVYVTDSPKTELPSGVAMLSVGRPLENVGIAGVTTEETNDGVHWQAVLVNPSDKPATRQWSLEWNHSQTTPAQQVVLSAKGLTTIQGMMPKDATRLVLHLNGDDFTLDDAFPFVRPVPKPLDMAVIGNGIAPWLIERMPHAIPRLAIAPSATADFALIGINDPTKIPASAGVVFSTAGNQSDPFLNQSVVATAHPLVRELNWAGLMVQEVPSPPPAPNDTVLLWSGERPLISLRMPIAEKATNAENPDTNPQSLKIPAPGPQLVLHFNPSLSNLDRLPAGVILLLRFCESLRDAKPATAWQQLEPGQAIARLLPESTVAPVMVESLATNGTTIVTHPLTAGERAPNDPGFLRIRDSRTVLMEAAVAFADARESDFRNCSQTDTTAEAIARASRETNPSDDSMLPLLALAALSALLAVYHYTGPTERTAKTETHPAVPSPTA